MAVDLRRLYALLSRPYPKIVVTGDLALLQIDEKAFLPIPSADRPLAIAYATERMTPAQQRDLFLALLKRHPRDIDGRDLTELQERLRAAPL